MKIIRRRSARFKACQLNGSIRRLGVHEQITAVGAVQGAGFDQAKVGDENALARQMLVRPIKLLSVGCNSSTSGPPSLRSD